MMKNLTIVVQEIKSRSTINGRGGGGGPFNLRVELNPSGGVVIARRSLSGGLISIAGNPPPPPPPARRRRQGWPPEEGVAPADKALRQPTSTAAHTRCKVLGQDRIGGHLPPNPRAGQQAGSTPNQTNALLLGSLHLFSWF